MTSRIAKLREHIEFLEEEIVRISLEEEDAAKRAKEETLAHAKTVRESEEPCKNSISLIDALDAAISTLEALHQDNKTIGIISHVELLKERISTKIVVRKLAAGTSTLEIS
jgi:molecular chaperone GrpE (heat shock protein)